MSRNSTQALHNIRMLCRIQQVDEKILYERSRLILSIYRDVCWSAIGRAEEVQGAPGHGRHLPGGVRRQEKAAAGAVISG